MRLVVRVGSTMLGRQFVVYGSVNVIYLCSLRLWLFRDAGMKLGDVSTFGGLATL